jgi:hypothetical protein
LRDKVALLIDEKMSCTKSLSPNVTRVSKTPVIHGPDRMIQSENAMCAGNGLKPSAVKGLISDAVKAFLTKLFLQGINPDGSVNKSRKYSVSRAREALEEEIRSERSNLISSDMLKEQQISSIFSKLSRDLKEAYKITVLDLPINEIEDQSEEMATVV